jgi:hypothetical protein
MFTFFDDMASAQPLMEETMRKFGYAPEHNAWWYRFSEDKGEKNIFAVDSHGGALMTMVGRSQATIFSSPIAPPARRVPILIEYLEEMLRLPNIKKVELELETPLRRELLRALPSSLRARSINFTLTWPIMNMAAFDLSLPGGHYKSLRKEQHKFYREHVVTVLDGKTFEDKPSLLAIIDAWKERRTVGDTAFSHEYMNLIANNFEGTATARIFIVDGVPVGINAGWMIPNSDRFYGAVGIHNYAVPHIGAMLYLEDLAWLKTHGYTIVDMGGSWKGGLEFKKEFLPESYYKTHTFSIGRR